MISIITCAYNRPTMLAEAIASIQFQTRTDWEHLITDAASPDPEVWQNLSSIRDPRVRVFREEQGVDQPAKFWNAMLDKVNGEYICFLDDDNTKFPMFLEKMVGTLEADPSLDAVTCGFIARFPDGHSEENHLNLRTGELILERNTVDTGCFVIRREAMERIGYFPEDIRTNEDWAMAKRMHFILHVKHLPDCLATWREHAGQRMARCIDLGNERDKATIRGRDWKPDLRVKVYPGAVGVVGVTDGLRQIPWVKEGHDVSIVLGIDGNKSSMIVTDAKNQWTVSGDGFVPVSGISESHVIRLKNKVQDQIAWRDRMARILNCVRSPRYGAAIP